MNNACLKIESEMVNPTIIEMMAELDKLRQENLKLKAEYNEVSNERDEWKEGFKLLHNIMESQNIDYTLLQTEDGEIGDMSYVDEYAKGNAEWDNLRIPTELDWKCEA